MTKRVAEYKAARVAAQNAYRRRRVIANEVSELHVTKNRRSVRVTVVLHLDKIRHRLPDLAPGTAFADLDDEQIDRLIRRLTAIRGGKRRTHTSNGHRRAA